MKDKEEEGNTALCYNALKRGEGMTTTATYREASRRLEAQAEEEYGARDLRQASEKGWGSAAQIVKAIAAHRGWRHDTHALLFQTVRDLDREIGGSELLGLFTQAHNLHVNFYEDWLTSEIVQRDLDNVRQFVEKLEALLPAETS